MSTTSEVKPKTRALAKAAPSKPVRDIDLSADKFVQLAVESKLFKDVQNSYAAVAKMVLGHQLGIDPVTAMQNIIIVNGKISFSANLVAARVNTSGTYRYEVVTKTAKECSIQFYKLIDDWTEQGVAFKRWTKPGPPETWTIERAKQAQLTNNPTWGKFPEAMLFCRALTAGARAYAPEVFCGTPCYTPDELDPSMAVTVADDGSIVVDAVDAVDAEVVGDPPAPKQRAKPKAAGGQLDFTLLKDLVAKTGVTREQVLEEFEIDANGSNWTPAKLAAAERWLQTRLDASPEAMKAAGGATTAVAS